MEMSDLRELPGEATSIEDQRSVILGFEERGLHLRAYDAAVQTLESHPNDPWLRHRAVLALARSGATKTALDRYQEYRLDEEDDEDAAALGARLAKDLAWAATKEDRPARAADAAARYRSVFDRTGGYFPAINAATMHLVAGDAAAAQSLARDIVAILEAQPPAEGREAYYQAATAAEAYLLLGHVARARGALARSVDACGDDLSVRATTRKQLRRICEISGLNPNVLDVLAAPRIIHYCGHMISAPGRDGRFRTDEEAKVSGQIRDHLVQTNVGFGFGSLASGADILFAEALLERGAELNVVLPFKADEFLDTSVRTSGSDWEARFRRCLEMASSRHFATEDSYLGDDHLFAYASQFAMGLALLRARDLDTDIEQVAVWDGEAPVGPAGTAPDVALWRDHGLAQTIIRVQGRRDLEASPPRRKLTAEVGRINRAMLFGDIKGFSKLNDRQLPVFVRQVLGSLARALVPYESSLCFRNTWGDGIYLVFDDLYEAARCALDLQIAIGKLPLAKLHLPEHIALRLGGHFGPVYEDTDPVMGTTNFFGAHVSRAARIEPITPEGSVYVTEHFAAGLELDPGRAFACEYVGTVPTAKGYGQLPMYLLRHSREA